MKFCELCGDELWRKADSPTLCCACLAQETTDPLEVADTEPNIDIDEAYERAAEQHRAELGEEFTLGSRVGRAFLRDVDTRERALSRSLCDCDVHKKGGA